MSVMQKIEFETLDALKEYINNSPTGEHSYTLLFEEGTQKESSPPSKNIEEDEEVKVTSISILSFSDLANIKLKRKLPLSESVDANNENIWFVDDYEFVEGACSTGKITFKDSTLLMNICESEGSSRVDLLLELNGIIQTKSFTLKKSCTDQPQYDMILAL